MLVVPSLNWVLITGLVFCCLFQWGFLCNLGANKFEPRLELSSGPGVRGWILISREQVCLHCGSARGSAWVNKESSTAYIPFFSSTPVARSWSLIRRLVYHHRARAWTFPLIAAYRLSRVRWFSRVLASRSLYYPWGKMGTTRSLGVHYLWYQSS